ncbi:MAG TPA: hypothetical protein VGO29_00475 [Solirubrobacteraceae bacterium]|jgi:hypothetical protein|nr:hypothetical protein [Solirubrobacteraceae bacterium]
MRKRLKTTIGATAALAALALGGSAIATATQSTPSKGTTHAAKHVVKKAPEKTGGVDTDTVQSGDQTSPDTSGAKASSVSSAAAGSESSSETSSETTSETSSESASASDGPGGHEDPPGNVENQSEAQE